MNESPTSRPKRKQTMTREWRETLALARAERRRRAIERGSYVTEEGRKKLSEVSSAPKEMTPARVNFYKSRRKPASDEALGLIVQICDLIDQQGRLYNEIGRRVGMSGDALRVWKSGERIPKLSSVIDVAWALGYVLKLEKFEQRPRDKSVWKPMPSTFNDGTIR